MINYSWQNILSPVHVDMREKMSLRSLTDLVTKYFWQKKIPRVASDNVANRSGVLKWNLLIDRLDPKNIEYRKIKSFLGESCNCSWPSIAMWQLSIISLYDTGEWLHLKPAIKSYSTAYLDTKGWMSSWSVGRSCWTISECLHSNLHHQEQQRGGCVRCGGSNLPV